MPRHFRIQASLGGIDKDCGRHKLWLIIKSHRYRALVLVKQLWPKSSKFQQNMRLYHSHVTNISPWSGAIVHYMTGRKRVYLPQARPLHQCRPARKKVFELHSLFENGWHGKVSHYCDDADETFACCMSQLSDETHQFTHRPRIASNTTSNPL